jgi:hypothetical protein
MAVSLPCFSAENVNKHVIEVVAAFFTVKK